MCGTFKSIGSEYRLSASAAHAIEQTSIDKASGRRSLVDRNLVDRILVSELVDMESDDLLWEVVVCGTNLHA